MSKPAVDLSAPERSLPEIQSATAEDVVKIAVFGEIFWQQTRYAKSGMEYDGETVIEMINHILDSGVALIVKNAGEVVGLLLIIIANHPMNKHHLLGVEWVFYLAPELRRTGLGADLILAAEQQLRVKGVRYLTMVSLSEVDPESAAGLYKKLGFEHSETSFSKEISWH